MKEYDNNPNTNRTHVINALGCIDNIIESYDAGGFDAIRKDVLEELGNAKRTSLVLFSVSTSKSKTSLSDNLISNISSPVTIIDFITHCKFPSTNLNKSISPPYFNRSKNCL